MADNRENTLLQAIAEGGSVDSARTVDEVFLKAIADGSEKPEEIRNRLQYWLNQIEVGGGNPNYVETITGSLSNPWGEMNYSDLLDNLQRHYVTAIMRAIPPGGGDSLTFFLNPINAYDVEGSGAFYNYETGQSPSLKEAFSVHWENGRLQYAVITQGGVDTDITAYASMSETTLTIIHHPLST